MQPRATTRGLVLQLAAKLTKPRVQHVLSEPPIVTHALHVQVLNADVRVVACKPRGDLPDSVRTLVSDMSVNGLNSF